MCSASHRSTSASGYQHTPARKGRVVHRFEFVRGCVGHHHARRPWATDDQGFAVRNHAIRFERDSPPVCGVLEEQLTVATDGSVRGRHTGYSWLASDGRYRLRGSAKPGSLRRREAVLFGELNAIEDAVRSLPGHPLVVLTDSKTARTLVCAWMDGHAVNPPGFRSSALEQHRKAIAENYSTKALMPCRGWLLATHEATAT